MAKPGGGTGGGGGTAVRGTSGNDPWYISTPAELAAFAQSTYDGRGGSDTFDFTGIASGIFISLTNGTTLNSRVSVEQGLIGIPASLVNSNNIQGVVSNTIRNVENVIGGSGNDMLWSNDRLSSNYLNGGAGNDWVSSGSNADAALRDVLVGGPGQDWVDGLEDTRPEACGTAASAEFPTGDGEGDTFITDNGIILDFEVGIDRFMLINSNYDIAGILAKPWVDFEWTAPTGNKHDSAALYVLDRPIILVGVTVVEAETIELAFRVGTRVRTV